MVRVIGRRSLRVHRLSTDLNVRRSLTARKQEHDQIARPARSYPGAADCVLSGRPGKGDAPAPRIGNLYSGPPYILV